MSLSTYAALQAFVASHLHRTDQAANIPDFITQMEDEARVFLRTRRAVGQYKATILANTENAALPSDFGRAISLKRTGDDTPLDFRTADAMAQRKRSDGTTGNPTDFAIIGSSLVLHPVPSSDVELQLTYYLGLAPLSASTTSNWLLANHSQVYVDGSMWKAYEFILDYERAAVRKEQFYVGLQAIVMADGLDSQAERLTPQPSLIV